MKTTSATMINIQSCLAKEDMKTFDIEILR